MRMFTCVWGEKHLDWMEKALIRSLCWPLNKAALSKATWHIFTLPEDATRVLALAGRVGVAGVVIEEISPETFEPHRMGVGMLTAILKIMRICVDNSEPLFMAPPDTIFSEGSVPNIVQMGSQRGVCVAVPHARVTPEVLRSGGSNLLSGQDLVWFLEHHGHEAWKSCELGGKGSYVGGMVWQRVSTSPSLILLQHQLPTVYFANFVETDIEFFKTPHGGMEPVFGAWDHLWPQKLIIEQRQRTPGSSDVACILEVTPEGANIPTPMSPPNPDEPDGFWRNAFHNRHNRQIFYVYRGE